MLVLRLVEPGGCGWTTPWAAHVPELAGAALGGRTLGELLAHGGGVIRDSEDGDFWQGAEISPIGRRCWRSPRPTARRDDRNERWKYSNIGYGLIGLVLEAVTGRGFAELVADEITGPLGLPDTGGELDPAGPRTTPPGTADWPPAGAAGLPHVDTARWPRPPAASPPPRTSPPSSVRCSPASTPC